MKASILLLLGLVALVSGFAPSRAAARAALIAQPTTPSATACPPYTTTSPSSTTSTQLFDKLSRKRRDQLGVGDDEEEYDLDVALAQNTDDFISKVVAGSLIVTIVCLLVAGIVIPATTDFGDGVCNPLLTGGRC